MSRGAAAARHCGLNNQTNNIKILFKDIQVLYVAPSVTWNVARPVEVREKDQIPIQNYAA